MGNQKKEKFELDVFMRFSEISELSVDLGSIQQLSPPQPDIICQVEGILRAFELTLITDQPIEKKVRLGRSGCSNFKIEISDVIEIIKRKSAKEYSVKVVDLVIHEGATPIDDLWLYDQEELANRIQAETNASGFQRVWILDMTNTLVRKFENRVLLPCF